jgi:hypothetical protein
MCTADIIWWKIEDNTLKNNARWYRITQTI